MSTLQHALRQATLERLDRLDAQMLLLHALCRSPHDRAWLIAHDSDPMPPDAEVRWNALVQRRLAGEPVAYLLGEKEFGGLTLQVDHRVLVPRPDTEVLVEWALDALPAPGSGSPRLLDLGTGSGAIALAIAAWRNDVLVTATDASPGALAVARANAQRLNLPVRFSLGAWLAAVSGERFDVIVSNPPYIAEGDPHLAALTHEPSSALTAGADGLDDIRTIVAQAPAALLPGGWLLLEHGHDQAMAVRERLTAQGFQAVGSRPDLAGIDRCSGGQWPLAR